MFRLIRIWDSERELSPEDFQYILRPSVAFEQARIYYHVSEDDYHYTDAKISGFDPPRRKQGHVNLFAVSGQRRRAGYRDNVYDNTERNLDMGWLIGCNTFEGWDHRKNPFYFDDKGELIYDCFMDHWHPWFEMHVRQAYEKCLNNHNGRKPEPTVKQRAYPYGGEPEQHAQAAKTINSKAAGRLLAAGGIYNGNIEGFKQTANQLGGDAPAGYDQLMNDQSKGLIIAGASIAAGLGIGRLGAMSELGELSKLSKIPKFESVSAAGGYVTKEGYLLNAKHAVIDPKKMVSYALNPNHPHGGNKARVFESALGYNPSNVDTLATRVHQGVLNSPAVIKDATQHGQLLGVNMPILGVNGETVIVRTGWIYEPEAVVPRMTTIFVDK